MRFKEQSFNVCLSRRSKQISPPLFVKSSVDLSRENHYMLVTGRIALEYFLRPILLLRL